MTVRVEFELTQVLVAEAILERARIEASSTGYLDPLTRAQAMRWVRTALLSWGRHLWASVEDAPVEARRTTLDAARRLFPELPPGDTRTFLKT